MNRHEQILFVVEAEIDLGNPFETVELNRSYPVRDADGVLHRHSLPDVLIGAGEALQEMIDGGKFSEDMVMKITVREMTEADE